MKRFIENRPSSDTARRPLPPLAGNLLFLGALFAMSLLVMAIEKPLFLLWYHAQAAEASAAELALVVWNGLKLDQTVAGYITALPLLVVLAALWIPGRWSRSVLKGYLLVIAAVSATAFAANLALYEYWAFPLDSSVLQYLASPKEALASVTAGQLLLQLLVAAAVFGGMAWCYLRVLRLYDPARRSTHRAGSTLVLLEGMRTHGVKKFVFSSSATVYGMNNPVPFKEGMPTSSCRSAAGYRWQRPMSRRSISAVGCS